MSFQDLPPDWPTRPVTDPAITADLLDLVVGDRDRKDGAVGLLLCGPSGRLVQPVVVSMLPPHSTTAERRQVFDVMCQAMRRGEPSGTPGLLVAVARPGAPQARPQDLRWQEAAAESCLEHEVDLLGVWLMTPSSVEPLPPAAFQRRSA